MGDNCSTTDAAAVQLVKHLFYARLLPLVVVVGVVSARVWRAETPGRSAGGRRAVPERAVAPLRAPRARHLRLRARAGADGPAGAAERRAHAALDRRRAPLPGARPVLLRAPGLPAGQRAHGEQRVDRGLPHAE